MTDIEKKIVENDKLVYYVMKKHNIKEDEDLYQVGLIGLWKAIKSFDESKNYQFSTYACEIIYREFMRELKSRSKHMNKIVSFEEPINPYDSDSAITLEGSLESPETIDDYITDIEFRSNVNSLDDRDKYLLSLIVKGHTQMELSKILHRSQTQISRDIKSLKNKLLYAGDPIPA